MSSLTDIFTTAKNIVTAISTIGQDYMNVQGTATKTSISSATVVRTGAGRIVNISVTVAGAAGVIYDSNSTSVTTAPIAVVPAVVGVYVINMPVANGIVAAPGAGQTFSLSYS